MVPQTNSILLRGLVAPTSGEELWRQFYDAYRSAVLGWCRGMGLRECQAEDILQNTMTKMFLQIGSYKRDKGRFAPWLKTIVMNEIRDRFRKLGKSEMMPAVGGSTHRQLFENQANEYENQDRDEQRLEGESAVAEVLQSVRDRVKAESWDIFVRTKFLGQDAKTVAEEFGIKRASVYQSVSRISKMLKEECESQLWQND